MDLGHFPQTQFEPDIPSIVWQSSLSNARSDGGRQVLVSLQCLLVSLTTQRG